MLVKAELTGKHKVSKSQNLHKVYIICWHFTESNCVQHSRQLCHMSSCCGRLINIIFLNPQTNIISSHIGNYNQNKEIGYHKVKQVFNQSGIKFSINTHGHMTCSKLFTHCLNLYDTAFQYSHMNWDITSQKPHNWINKIWYPDKIFIASVENIRTTSLCTLYSACKMLAKCSVLVI